MIAYFSNSVASFHKLGAKESWKRIAELHLPPYYLGNVATYICHEVAACHDLGLLVNVHSRVYEQNLFRYITLVGRSIFKVLS
ncbi:hypothetical protein HanHA89_Chr10g0388611 [Helianthus annuus]|nr:hypothetical protein HanHA89_Chr10g0388611 [Helianthus annuus]